MNAEAMAARLMKILETAITDIGSDEEDPLTHAAVVMQEDNSLALITWGGNVYLLTVKMAHVVVLASGVDGQPRLAARAVGDDERARELEAAISAAVDDFERRDEVSGMDRLRAALSATTAGEDRDRDAWLAHDSLLSRYSAPSVQRCPGRSCHPRARF